jgi:hypothetical protein
MEDLPAIYRQHSTSGRDRKIKEYEYFFMDLLKNLYNTSCEKERKIKPIN